MMNFSIGPVAGAPLRNREPATAPATFTSVIDETLHLVSGSTLDFSGFRATATPAGSRGRITASGDKVYENGAAVRFNIVTMQPEPAFTPIPTDHATIDAGVRYLARCGYNAIRLMGLEHLVMYHVPGVAVFDSAQLDAVDYFMAACKREGIFWIICPQSYGLYLDMDVTRSRFDFQEMNGFGPYSCKPRMYTEQDIRDNWKLGTGRLYNRVNPYTGINILQDPALVLFEFYNEADTTFCASVSWPVAWNTRYTSNAAAKTLPEWLADPTASHGYANLAAANAAWGTAYASFALAAAGIGAALTNSLPNTTQSIDIQSYAQYLEDNMVSWYATVMSEWGYTGMMAQHMFYPQNFSAKNVFKASTDSVANFHTYLTLAYGVTTGVATTDSDQPIWEKERAVMAMAASAGAKPVWLGEVGEHTYARWRPHFALMAANAAAQGVSALSFFTQGDFFYPSYYNDATTHGDRFRRIDNFPAPGAHVNDFMRALYAAVFLRGDVAELTATQNLLINDRYTGFNPRSTGRQSRQYSTLFQPLQFIGALAKTRLAWTEDTTDDTFASVWNAKSYLLMLQDLQTAGAIAADHPSLVSATANSGTIISVATTGTVGGLTASTASPVLDIGSNTLVNGDMIHVTNMTGSIGTWPGINLRQTRSMVLKGTGNYVQLLADSPSSTPGLSLAGLSGANFTAGTWCEGANLLESGSREWGMSRRLKRCFINTAKTIFFGHTNATLPATFGALIVSALSQNASIFVISLDGVAIATSSRLLIGMCGEAINTGMTYTVGADGKQTLTATGNYPVQQLDATATLSLGITSPRAWSLYRLGRNGERMSMESPAEIDADAARLIVTLRTGTVQPACLWELVR